MFKSRRTQSSPDWSDSDGIKIYTISANVEAVDHEPFVPRLAEVKSQHPVAWSETAAFCIFHAGETMLYLVLAWWGNGNELFTSVSVLTDDGWVEDSTRFSFCLYDLEVFWKERNLYIETMYSGAPDIIAYRRRRA